MAEMLVMHGAIASPAGTPPTHKCAPSLCARAALSFGPEETPMSAHSNFEVVKAAPSAAAELDPVDLYNVRSMLNDEERLVQDSVAKFVDEQVLPIIGECFEHERFPRELVTGVAELGLLGSSIHGYGCAGLNAVSYGLICQELERGDSGLRSFVSVQSSLCMYPIYAFGSEEQKQRWLPSMAQ